MKIIALPRVAAPNNPRHSTQREYP